MESVLAQYGLAGLVIAVLSGTVAFLFKELKAAYNDKTELQNARLEDSKEARRQYDETMGKFSQSFDLFVARLDSKEK